jgi:multidrug efflux pump subunit AcrB
VASIAATVQGALSGVDTTYLHDGHSKYPVPVRLQLPREAQVGLDALLALPCAPATANWCPERTGARGARHHRQAAVHQGPAARELRVRRRGRRWQHPDSPLYGLFNIRAKLQAAALPNTGTLGEYWINQPADPYREYAIKWDGESQITYETFRDMGAAYGVGLILIYLLVVAQFKSYLTPLIIMAPIPLTIIGVMPGHASSAPTSRPPA